MAVQHGETLDVSDLAAKRALSRQLAKGLAGKSQQNFRHLLFLWGTVGRLGNTGVTALAEQ